MTAGRAPPAVTAGAVWGFRGRCLENGLDSVFKHKVMWETEEALIQLRAMGAAGA